MDLVEKEWTAKATAIPIPPEVEKPQRVLLSGDGTSAEAFSVIPTFTPLTDEDKAPVPGVEDGEEFGAGTSESEKPREKKRRPRRRRGRGKKKSGEQQTPDAPKAEASPTTAPKSAPDDKGPVAEAPSASEAAPKAESAAGDGKTSEGKGTGKKRRRRRRRRGGKKPS